MVGALILNKITRFNFIKNTLFLIFIELNINSALGKSNFFPKTYKNLFAYFMK